MALKGKKSPCECARSLFKDLVTFDLLGLFLEIEADEKFALLCNSQFTNGILTFSCSAWHFVTVSWLAKQKMGASACGQTLISQYGLERAGGRDVRSRQEAGIAVIVICGGWSNS